MAGLPHNSFLSSYWSALRTEPLSALPSSSFFFECLSGPLRNYGKWIHQWVKKETAVSQCTHTGTNSILGAISEEKNIDALNEEHFVFCSSGEKERALALCGSFVIKGFWLQGGGMMG